MDNLKINDLMDYTFLSGLVASPDGRKCAFVANRADIQANAYIHNIYLLDCATRSVRRMSGIGAEKSVTWLDNETLLFPALRDKALAERVALGEPWTCYYALPIGGGEATEYMRIPKRVTAIKAIDRDRFVILANHYLDVSDPFTLNEKERENHLSRMKKREESYFVADEIPFRRNGMGHYNGIRTRMYIFDRRNRSLTPVTEETQNVDFFEVEGNRVVFSAKHFRKESPKIFQGGLSVYNIDAGTLKQYVDEESFRMRYCGFINGVPVFMGSRGERYYYQENPYFWYIDESTGETCLFAENEDSADNSITTDSRYGSSATIQAAGDYLYYVKTICNHAHLMRVDRSGNFSQLTQAGGTVDGVAVCGDEIYMIAMRGNRIGELYLLKDGREEQLTFFNEWVQKERKLSTPIEIKFPNDGFELDGVVIPPVDHVAGEKAPAILYIHGGHKMAFGTVFYHEMQVWANLGYYVIYCNPRGSDGRDNDFFEITGRYGIEDYSDIMRFVDTCLERYTDIDVHRLGVGGGSYGGYMTNWVIGHTDRFRCAVSQRGISSWATMFTTSDTSYQFPMYQADSNIWDNIQSYLYHSPLTYANKCTTPTLFIHSDEDYRCPVSEGIAMFTALKYNGVPARMCIFRGENHELSRSGKPENRLNRLAEITGWYERYLK